MSVLNHISSAFYCRNEGPNKKLAQQIAQTHADDLVKELVDNLYNPDKSIQSDCIKVLYEIGEHGAAELIAPYADQFIELLSSNNNRMVWGAMSALDTIAAVNPAPIYRSLSQVVEAIDKGSVITKDRGVGVLATLAGIDEYADVAKPLLFEQLRVCVAKQLPQYAEKASMVVKADDKEQLVRIIYERFEEVETDTRKKRLTKLLKKLEKHSR